MLLTSPVHLVFALVVWCDYPQSTEVTEDGCRLLTLIIHTPATLASPLLLCPLGVDSSLNSFVLLFRLGCSFAWSLALTSFSLREVQRRPAHAKPDFN